MEQFAYSFAITLMHSLWQMALLLLLYQITVKLISNWPPLAKRNLLFLLLGAQFVCSVISFYIVYSEPFYDFRANVQQLLSSFISTQTWLQSYAETIFWLYAFMVMYKLVSALIQWINFSQRYKSDLTKPSIDLRLFTQTKAYHFGISRKVTIWYSKTIHNPMTFGFWKPVILLPITLVNQLTVEQTESLIIHELSHIKNNDYLLNWMLVVSESIYFFNPFVKIIAQKIKLEREKNCDVQVLQFNYPAIGYAETLLHTAHQQKLAYSLQMSAVKSKQELLKRIQYFTQNNNFNDNQHRQFPFAAFSIFVFMLLNLFLAGYFLHNDNAGQSAISSDPFVAMPINEWNKSFNTEPLTNNNTALVKSPKVAKVKSTIPAKASASTPVNPETDLAMELHYEQTTFTPVSLNEQPVDLKREIVVNEEISSGKIITKVYQLVYVKGEMVLQPLFMTAEVKPLLSDSLKQKIKVDSTELYKLIPTVQ